MWFLLPLAVVGAYLFKKKRDEMTLQPHQEDLSYTDSQPVQTSNLMFAPEQPIVFAPEPGKLPLINPPAPTLSMQSRSAMTPIAKLATRSGIVAGARAVQGRTITKPIVRLK